MSSDQKLQTGVAAPAPAADRVNGPTCRCGCLEVRSENVSFVCVALTIVCLAIGMMWLVETAELSEKCNSANQFSTFTVCNSTYRTKCEMAMDVSSAITELDQCDDWKKTECTRYMIACKQPVLLAAGYRWVSILYNIAYGVLRIPVFFYNYLTNRDALDTWDSWVMMALGGMGLKDKLLFGTVGVTLGVIIAYKGWGDRCQRVADVAKSVAPSISVAATPGAMGTIAGFFAVLGGISAVAHAWKAPLPTTTASQPTAPAGAAAAAVPATAPPAVATAPATPPVATTTTTTTASAPAVAAVAAVPATAPVATAPAAPPATAVPWYEQQVPPALSYQLWLQATQMAQQQQQSQHWPTQPMAPMVQQQQRQQQQQQQQHVEGQPQPQPRAARKYIHKKSTPSATTNATTATNMYLDHSVDTPLVTQPSAERLKDRATKRRSRFASGSSHNSSEEERVLARAQTARENIQSWNRAR